LVQRGQEARLDGHFRRQAVEGVEETEAQARV